MVSRANLEANPGRRCKAGVPAGTRHAKLRYTFSNQTARASLSALFVLAHQGRDDLNDPFLLKAWQSRHILKDLLQPTGRGLAGYLH
jgi:hypothetical protein